MKKLFTVFLSIFFAASLTALTDDAYSAESIKDLPKIKWRLQAAFPGGPSVEYGGQKFQSSIDYVRSICNEVKKRTDGKFEIEVYEPGLLYGPGDFYDALSSGAVDAIYSFGWYFSGQMPVGRMDPGIFFMFKSAKDYIPTIFENDEWFKVVREAYAEHNMYYLAPTAFGSKTFITNFPINSIDDFSGRLMRGVGPEADMLNRFGAKATFVSPSEIYMALQRGTIDGLAWSFPASAMAGWMEVYKYASWPPYFAPLMTQIATSLGSWNKLPKAYQDILTEEAMKRSRWSFEIASDAMDQWAKEVAAPKHGVEVIELSDEAWAEMRNKQLVLWEDYAAKDKYCGRLLEIYKKAAKN